MEFNLNIFILMLLAVIVYQDFRYRAIPWITLPLLFAAFAINSVLATDFNSFLQSLLFNICFIVFQLIIITAYFSLKNGTITNITSKHLGWGDILFFFVLCAVFSPVNFILFYIFSLIIILSVFITYKFFKKNSSVEIPLAGGMAALLIVCQMLNLSFEDFDLLGNVQFLVLNSFFNS